MGFFSVLQHFFVQNHTYMKLYFTNSFTSNLHILPTFTGEYSISHTSTLYTVIHHLKIFYYTIKIIQLFIDTTTNTSHKVSNKLRCKTKFHKIRIPNLHVQKLCTNEEMVPCILISKLSSQHCGSVLIYVFSESI